jgi:hypothetical protein
MRTFAIAALILLAGTAPRCTSATQTAKLNTVELFDKGLTLTLPAGFTPMTSSEIDLKYGRVSGRRPVAAYANKERNISIAAIRPGTKITPAEFDKFRDAMAGAVTSIQGSKLLRKENVTINGSSWGRIEMTAPAVDTTIYNDMYLGILRGQVVGLNFNTVVRLQENAQKLFDVARKSLKLNEKAEGEKGQ